MKNNNLTTNTGQAVKWSTITEFGAKIIIPITNMILARLLAPEAFGVLATVILVTSFADMLSDSGFQKYLIQKEFRNIEERIQSTNVAFWTNFIISIFLWLGIVFFKDQIAIMVGNSELGWVIAIASISIPLTSLSSIQMAVYRRDLNYKPLFYVRIIGVLIPFFVTIPLALLEFSYWSLIVGMIIGNLFNAILLTYKSDWKPQIYYSFGLLKNMFSFSMWSLLESFSIWLTTYIGVFIVANTLNSYYLGLYQTTITTISGILAIITTATTSVLFSSLSRLQNDDKEFYEVFMKFMRLISMVMLPMGVGIYVYRNLITELLLGSQWVEASLFVGLWGLTSAITIVFGQFFSEIYRAKGKPKLSVLVQLLHLVFLIPTLMITVNYSFEALVYGRSIIKLQLIAANLIIMHVVFKFSSLIFIKNTLPAIYSSFIMFGIAKLLMMVNSSYWWEISSIILCIGTYIALIIQYDQPRKEIIAIFKVVNNKYLNKVVHILEGKKLFKLL
ncbi:polysaccharide biosynthesis protein [Planococcus donghaensis MPA1U2]|uniref:Polysaccharide biosynthesis protein n=1 Tax=Planococcus donghaensis MPA1U2 TaxID=933115 RepID=E7RDS5_9BACL|nr:lipopolysaccharide biosynthesis protein [Planococcus donghaensis]EGA90831.1 polysaccharide biosynthesis protein [Planococcus donghaensis MPA1U2]